MSMIDPERYDELLPSSDDLEDDEDPYEPDVYHDLTYDAMANEDDE